MAAPSLAEWTAAPRLPARPVAGFLPTKAPISLPSAQPEDEGDRYDVSMFMDRQTSALRSVGMCVDTTVPQSGARLFEASEWDDYDVKHVAVPCSPLLPAAPGEKGGASDAAIACCRCASSRACSSASRSDTWTAC